MVDPTPPSGDRPLKADPEVIAIPAEQGPTSASSLAEPAQNATFASTKQHVAVGQESDDKVERFANTKHNIALINDPKNGPRFTLTKKEAGLPEETVDDGERTGTDLVPCPSSSDDSQTDKLKEGLKTEDRQTSTEIGAAKKPTQISGTEHKLTAKIDRVDTEDRPPKRPFAPPPPAESPIKVPIDSAKTFIGPNGTYYDDCWRWMDWQGKKRSWNWPAALSFGHWFAYRRLYGHAGIYLAWLTGLAAALVNNVHVALVACLLVLTPVLIGFYANTLYFSAFRRAAVHVTEKGEGSYDERQQQLAKAGGINPHAPWYMAGTMIIGICLALVATHISRGGFQVNIWPF